VVNKKWTQVQNPAKITKKITKISTYLKFQQSLDGFYSSPLTISAFLTIVATKTTTTIITKITMITKITIIT
jgi:hypothetical protein